MPAIANSNVASHYRVTRGDSNDEESDSTINILAIVLAIIVALGIILLGALLILKRARRQRSSQQQSHPPQYNEVVQQDKNHHRLTIETRGAGGCRTSILYNKDGRPMLANPNSPPHSPDNVPEIHITFPDEEAAEGSKRKSGRVVVVRVGDNAAVGMRPLDGDELPAYEKESNGSFYSIDMDDIGGLREKEREDYR